MKKIRSAGLRVSGSAGQRVCGSARPSHRLGAPRVTGSVAIVALLSIGLFIAQVAARPLRQEWRVKMQALALLRGKIDRVETLLKGYTNMGEGIIALKEKNKALEGRIPYREASSSLLKELSEQALRFGVRVLTVSPSSPAVFSAVDKSVCMKVQIELRAEGRFRNIGEYIEALKKDVSVSLTVEELILQRAPEISPNIRARILVAQYVLREE